MKKFIITEKQEHILKEYLDRKFGIPLKNELLKYKEILVRDHIDEYPEWYREYGCEPCDRDWIEDYLEDFENQSEDRQIEYALFDEGSEPQYSFANFLYDKYVLKKRYYWENNDDFDEDEFDDYNEYEDYYRFGDDIWPIMKYKEDFTNKWLLNYTSNAEFIAKNGFTESNTDISDLPCTTNVFRPAKVGEEGYNFAYDAESNETFYKSLFSYGSSPRNGAVLFQASGIKAYHNGDNEDQVMFYNNDAKNIIPLYYEKGKWFVKSVITGKPLRIESPNQFGNRDWDYGEERKRIERGRHNIDKHDESHYKNLFTLRNLVTWIINNFDQYRKHLVYPNQSKVRRIKNNKSIYSKELKKRKNGNNIQRS